MCQIENFPEIFLSDINFRRHIIFWNHCPWKYDMSCSKKFEFLMTEIQKIFRIQVRFCMKTLIWLTTTFFRSILTLMNQHGIRIVRSGHPNFWQGCRPRPSLLKSIQDTVFWAWKKITWKRSLRQFYRQRGKDLAFLWAYSIYFSNI